MNSENIPVQTKQCSCCHENKTLDNFCKMSKAPDGKHYHCNSCRSIYAKKRREKRRLDPVMVAADRAWDRARNQTANRKKWSRKYRNQQNRHQKHNLKFHYGLSLEDYEQMLSTQNGVCAICGNPETVKQRGKLQKLAVDHNDDTGQIRDLLCGLHNVGLGSFSHDPALLRAAADYMERHNAKTEARYVPRRIIPFSKAA